MKIKAIFFAIVAAALYAVNIPFSKLLLKHVSPTMNAAFLYLGAGIGMIIYAFIMKKSKKNAEKKPLTKKELPYTVAMVVLDIAAPILMMFGITKTASANASLLNNFEIVATTVIAWLIYKETVSKRLLVSICLATVASGVLSFSGNGAFSFDVGSLYVLAACTCWGFENNCTKMLSQKSSEEIVIIKGIFSGIGSFITATVIGERLPSAVWIAAIMLLGFAAYGLSINFYITAQKYLGAAKTSAYYSVAPFFGVIFSMLFIGERPNVKFGIALIIMIASTVLTVKDTLKTEKNQ